MQTTVSSHVPGPGSVPAQTRRAFTLLELLVIVGVLLLLAASLLPTLARSSANTKVTACAANFRQWAVSVNLYAQDNKAYLPRPYADPGGGGDYGWDVSTNLCSAMFPYGLTISTWFCPVRSSELDAANSWGQSVFLHPILSIQDLQAYFMRLYSHELQMTHNWWVPRAQGGVLYPIDYSVKSVAFQPTFGRGSDPFVYGWPVRVDDRASARVAFISDKCGSGNGNGFPTSWTSVGSNVTNIAPNTAHFFNGVLQGVNAAYVDGHVESRGPSKMRCVYSNGTSYWFY